MYWYTKRANSQMIRRRRRLVPSDWTGTLRAHSEMTPGRACSAAASLAWRSRAAAAATLAATAAASAAAALTRVVRSSACLTLSAAPAA